MLQTCPKCKKLFDKYKEQTCKECYENVIFRGQCLNIAALLLKDEWNPKHEDFTKKLFKLAEDIYNDGIKYRK